ncbi:energy-coupling factor transporter transmembrane component T family protein [Acinetobacter larvae]|uniref:Cobalt transporter n=1 Tax=Acinetobacter larvae TaxID=1789224 RepID=A0A1B2LYR9_9GAMM|nr:energy-coupling factor transporter transmembrane component T [Acinetobacter larvae]AOA57923.1 hypothetical protein BFG52_05865 [Acinetobacter larvae]
MVLKFDPRLIFLLMLIAGLALASVSQNIFYSLLTATSLLYICAGGKRIIFFSCYFLLSYALLYLLQHYAHSAAIKFFAIFIFLSHRMILILLLSDLMKSYATGQIIAALRKLKLPMQVIIPLLIAMRYFPDLKESIHNIKDAIRIRKLQIGLLHPLNSFQYLVIPLIHKSLNTAGEIAESISSKGIEYAGERSSYHQLHFGLLDYAVLAIFLTIFIGGLCYV